MCVKLEISKWTYYKYWDSDDPDYLDYIMIKKVFDDVKGTYGYNWITEGLKIECGVIFNHKKVARIMKKYNIKTAYIRKVKPYIDYKRIEENVKQNLLNKNLIDVLNRVWNTDVTYLIFKNKRLYLSTIIDLYDKNVVSYKISKFNDINLVMSTLNNAIEKEKNAHGLIIHSDQGFQYTSYPYKDVCKSNGITISMARKDIPLDNALIESWHVSLKKETLHNNNITFYKNTNNL